MFGASFVGLSVEVDLREVMQRKNADHAHDDCRQHDLHNGPVLEQELADENMVGADAALLQQKAKHKSEYDTSDNHRGGCRRCGLVELGFFDGFARIEHRLNPKHQVGDDGAADKEANHGDPGGDVQLKRAADTMPAGASSRETGTEAISAPPPNANALADQTVAKARAPHRRHPFVDETTSRQGGNSGASNGGEDKGEFPIQLGGLLLK